MKSDKESPFRFSPNPNKAHEIDWHEWNDAVFELARRQDKPILLGISATWCHWCHVMDETSYSDSEIIKTINQDYIAIRVDNDQRPEINRRYNQGGWPSTVFLTPGGDLITGGTYIAPAQMRSYLIQVRDFYHQHKLQIAQKVKEFDLQRDTGVLTSEKDQGMLTSVVIEKVGQIILERLDQVHGGFGSEPKFPHPAALLFALERSFETGDEHWKAVTEKTLPAMRKGGMFDHVGGGFFRYSTTRDWSIPHFEKMLEDNSLLLDVYLQAFQMTGNDLYKDTAQRIINYLEKALLNKNLGAFAGSQEANEEYFHLSRAERATRPAPGVDHVIYTDWNALAVIGYLRAYRVLGNRDFLDRAEGILRFLLTNSYVSETGMFHYWDGDRRVSGLLIDQVRVMRALLDAYETEFNRTYLETAETLATIVMRDFQDPSGGYFDISSAQAGKAHGALRNREKFIDDNSLAAEALLKLSRITGNLKYRVAAETALSLFTETYPDYELFAAPYGLAVAHILHAPVLVTIIGRIDDPKTMAFISESNRVYAPDKVIDVLDPVKDKKRIDDLGYAVQKESTAYLCMADKCLPPVTDPSEVESVIRSWEQE